MLVEQPRTLDELGELIERLETGEDKVQFSTLAGDRSKWLDVLYCSTPYTLKLRTEDNHVLRIEGHLVDLTDVKIEVMHGYRLIGTLDELKIK